MASVTVPFATLAAGAIEVSSTYDDGSLAVVSVTAANTSADAAVITLGPFSATLAAGGTRTVAIPKGRQPILTSDATTGVLSLPGWC